MKIIISDKLLNKYRNSLESETEKFKLFNNIERIANNKGEKETYTNDLQIFLNKMIGDINDYTALNIDPIFGLEKIKSRKDLDMYIAEIVDNNDVLIAQVVIATSDKLGNTLITQQLMGDFLSRASNDLPYIINTKIQKIVYFTFDFTNYVDNPKTLQPLLRSVKTLGYEVVEMFKTGNIPPQYTSINDLIEDLETAKNGKNDVEAGIRIKKTEQGNNELLLTVPKVEGQTSKYYALYLMAIYVLNHPKLVYNIKDGSEPDTTLQRVQEIFNRDVSQEHHENGKFVQDDIVDVEESALIPTGKGHNELVYGAPGTGKSFEVGQKYPDFRRVTFYPDYDYTQFVGGLKPVRSSDQKLDYKFVAGPFIDAMVDAYNNPANETGIIIEELNRANAPSVFGDVFQLLDRDEDGISDYAITNPELSEYLDERTANKFDFKKNGIRIPGNFSITATMNPADQGVYPIDAAFKRRWVQKYKSIDWNAEGIAKGVIAGFNASWPTVGKAINEFLGSEMGIDEDALLGEYFFKRDEISDIDKVSSKLLGYLWNDVVRYNRPDLFAEGISTLSDAITALKSNKPVFTEGVLALLRG